MSGTEGHHGAVSADVVEGAHVARAARYLTAIASETNCSRSMAEMRDGLTPMTRDKRRAVTRLVTRSILRISPEGSVVLTGDRVPRGPRAVNTHVYKLMQTWEKVGRCLP